MALLPLLCVGGVLVLLVLLLLLRADAAAAAPAAFVDIGAPTCGERVIGDGWQAVTLAAGATYTFTLLDKACADGSAHCPVYAFVVTEASYTSLKSAPRPSSLPAEAPLQALPLPLGAQPACCAHYELAVVGEARYIVLKQLAAGDQLPFAGGSSTAAMNPAASSVAANVTFTVKPLGSGDPCCAGAALGSRFQCACDVMARCDGVGVACVSGVCEQCPAGTLNCECGTNNGCVAGAFCDRRSVTVAGFDVRGRCTNDTAAITNAPTASPVTPTTAPPSVSPTAAPTPAPTEPQPSASPTGSPTAAPSPPTVSPPPTTATPSGGGMTPVLDADGCNSDASGICFAECAARGGVEKCKCTTVGAYVGFDCVMQSDSGSTPFTQSPFFYYYVGGGVGGLLYCCFFCLLLFCCAASMRKRRRRRRRDITSTRAVRQQQAQLEQQQRQLEQQQQQIEMLQSQRGGRPAAAGGAAGGSGGMRADAAATLAGGGGGGGGLAARPTTPLSPLQGGSAAQASTLPSFANGDSMRQGSSYDYRTATSQSYNGGSPRAAAAAGGGSEPADQIYANGGAVPGGPSSPRDGGVASPFGDGEYGAASDMLPANGTNYASNGGVGGGGGGGGGDYPPPPPSEAGGIYQPAPADGGTIGTVGSGGGTFMTARSEAGGVYQPAPAPDAGGALGLGSLGFGAGASGAAAAGAAGDFVAPNGARGEYGEAGLDARASVFGFGDDNGSAVGVGGGGGGGAGASGAQRTDAYLLDADGSGFVPQRTDAYLETDGEFVAPRGGAPLLPDDGQYQDLPRSPGGSEWGQTVNSATSGQQPPPGAGGYDPRESHWG